MGVIEDGQQWTMATLTPQDEQKNGLAEEQERKGVETSGCSILYQLSRGWSEMVRTRTGVKVAPSSPFSPEGHPRSPPDGWVRRKYGSAPRCHASHGAMVRS